MTSPMEIRSAILTILEAGKPKNSEGQGVKKWYRGEKALGSINGFPCGWVVWAGGPAEAPVGSKQLFRDAFHIVVVDKNVDAEKAEDSVESFCPSVEDVLAAAATLGDTVSQSWVSNREKEKIFLGDYSVVACRITVQSWRRE